MFDSISKKLSEITGYAVDKIGHAFAGFLIASTVYFIVLLTDCPQSAERMAFWSAVTVGMLKELFDALVNWIRSRRGLPPVHTVEVEDVFATSVGGAVACVLISLFIQLSHG